MARTRQRRGRRNRKRHEARVRVPSPLVAVLVAAALLALAYLWICGRCDALGKELSALEQQKEETVRRRLNEELDLTNMKSPRMMERLLERHGLVMMLPRERRVVRVGSDTLAELDLEDAPRQFVERTGGYQHD